MRARHGRPVLRVEAAGAGLHLQTARARVEGPVQRLRELSFFKSFSQRVTVRRRLGVERLALLVVFRLREAVERGGGVLEERVARRDGVRSPFSAARRASAGAALSLSSQKSGAQGRRLEVPDVVLPGRHALGRRPRLRNLVGDRGEVGAQRLGSAARRAENDATSVSSRVASSVAEPASCVASSVAGCARRAASRSMVAAAWQHSCGSIANECTTARHV